MINLIALVEIEGPLIGLLPSRHLQRGLEAHKTWFSSIIQVDDEIRTRARILHERVRYPLPPQGVQNERHQRRCLEIVVPTVAIEIVVSPKYSIDPDNIRGCFIFSYCYIL